MNAMFGILSRKGFARRQFLCWTLSYVLLLAGILQFLPPRAAPDVVAAATAICADDGASLQTKHDPGHRDGRSGHIHCCCLTNSQHLSKLALAVLPVVIALIFTSEPPASSFILVAASVLPPPTWSISVRPRGPPGGSMRS